MPILLLELHQLLLLVLSSTAVASVVVLFSGKLLLFLPLKAMTERFLMVLLLSRKVLGPTITLPTTDSFGFDLMSFTTCTRFEHIMYTVHWRNRRPVQSRLWGKRTGFSLEMGLERRKGFTNPPIHTH
jgi:hypothetical protein